MMKKEDLIKNLRNIDLPEIILQDHKSRLKLALLDSRHFKQASASWIKRIVPAGVALVIFLVFGATVINPKLIEARLVRIAQKDPQIQKMMRENEAIIKEVMVKGDRGYVLLTLPEERFFERELSGAVGMPEILQFEPLEVKTPLGVAKRDGEPHFFSGSVAEIDLKVERVESIEMITEEDVFVSSLTDKEKKKAVRIVKSYAEMWRTIAEVGPAEVVVKPLPPLKLHLEEANGKIKVAPEPGEDKRVGVIFRIKDKEHIITVNLTQERTEGLMPGE